jgi:S-formylglutathione hydrolase FrmB
VNGANRDDRPRGPGPSQIRRRRRAALVVLALLAAAAVYVALVNTVLAPVDEHGATTTHLTVSSKALDRELGVNVVEPGELPPEGERSLLLFLHGHGGSEASFVEDEAVFRGLARLGARAPVIAFPYGGNSYWHDRDEGDWGRYVMREVIPTVVRRFGIDPRRVAVGGISMGGFGAYDLALDHPGRFCAVGGHSTALWFEGSETAPGAFEDAEDFEANDVIGRVRADPAAFGDIPVWNDVGTEDPFRVYDEGFVEALEAGDAEISAHIGPGGHETSYWDRHWPAYLRFYAEALEDCGR